MKNKQSVETELQLKYTPNYNQATLPHLLVEYGFEDQETIKRTQKRNAEKDRVKAAKKTTKRFDEFMNADDEKFRKRQDEKDEYYLKLVQDLYRFRDYYYKLYTQRLAQKVKRQQKEIREKDIQSREKREKQDKERNASYKMKKKLEYHMLDSSSATSFSKTDLYYIVRLEDKLLREGKLKTTADYNQFRLWIQDPHVFYTNFKVKKSSDLNKNQNSSLKHTSHPDQDNSADFVLPLTTENLSEVHHSSHDLQSSKYTPERRESSRSGSWAVTQQYSAEHKQRTSMSGLPASRNKQEINSDLDKRFPKVEMPDLHCFNMDLTSKPPELDQVQPPAELKAKEVQRTRLMKRVAKMYQVAMSNVATSARILDRHEDMDMVFNGPDLCDVISANHWIEAYRLRNTEQTNQTDEQSTCVDLLEQSRQEGTQGDGELVKFEHDDLSETDADKKQYVSYVVPHPIISSEEHSFVSRTSETRDESRNSSANSKKNLSRENRMVLPPLTIEEIRDKCNIVEAKSLSTFWMNYLAAGK
uniref:Uncharacterized protein n=1 Tax=Arion vulgaris TaxID=1028688 RepID=A0A0B6ZP99_9EUPU